MTLAGEIGAATIHAAIFRVPEGADKDKRSEALAKALEGVKAEICFCSTLNDCWLQAPARSW